MSVTVDYALRCNVAETLETEVDAAPSPVVNHTSFSSRGTLTATSTVPATKVSAETVALVAGAYTIDLTALNGTNGSTVVGTGLKVQLFKFKNLGTGTAATMTLTPGADAYNLFGAAFSVIVAAGQEIEFFGNDATPDVAAGSADEISVAGTGAETFELMIVLG
jgi:hypothetical protein